MIHLNPFTPKSGISPKLFLDRQEETDLFLKKIKDAQKGVPQHYIINGEWGIGKTTLLKYFKILAQKNKCFASFFPAREFMHNAEDMDIVIHILQSIIRDLPVKLKEKGSLFKRIKGFGVQILGSGMNLEFSNEINKNMDVQNLLLESLLGLWNDVKKETETMVVLIDDIQNWKEVSRIFTLLKNVLSYDELVQKTRYLFILSSTVLGWEQFIERNHPIGRFFIPRVELRRFSKINTIQMIKEFLKDTGVSFSDEVNDLVYDFTQGHLFEIHALCSSLYECEINGKVGKLQWVRGLEKGLMYLGNAVFDNFIQVSEKEKEVLFALSHFDQVVELSKILKKSRQLSLNTKNINQHVRRLVEKKVIQNPSRGNYIIKDKLLREYIEKMTINT